MSKIVNLFTDDTSINDCNVACYVKNILMLLLKTNPFAGLTNVVKHYLNKSFLKKFLFNSFFTLIT